MSMWIELLYSIQSSASKASRLILICKLILSNQSSRDHGINLIMILQIKQWRFRYQNCCEFQRPDWMKQLHTVQTIDSDQDDLKIPAPDFRYFNFPIIERLPQYFSSLEELNKTLDISLRNYNQSVSPPNRIEKTLVIRLNDGWITFKCKVFGCEAFLQFENEGTGLRLTKSSVEHKHFVRYGKNGKGRTPKIKNFEVEQCLDELQLLNFKPREIEVFIRERFKINSHNISAIKGVRNRKEIIKNLLECLSRIDNFKFECKDIHEIMAYYMKQPYNREERKQQRDVIIVVSQKMKTLYQNYHGEYVFFSIFPDFVLETRYSRKLKYQHMGVFYGEDTTNSLTLLFGIVYMRRPVRYAYLYILQKLFTFLGRYPKVLVTDYDPALTQAFKRLQKRYSSTGVLKLHLQLPNSFISNCFNLRSSPQFIAILSNQLENLLRQPDKKKHAARLKKILDRCDANPEPTQDRIAEQVERYVRENSFIYVQPLFIGLTMTPYSTASLLRARVLDFFKSPRPTVLALKAFLQIFKAYEILKYVDKDEVNARINPPKESISTMKIDLLYTLSRNLDQNIKLKQIIRSLSTSAALCFADSLEQCFKGQVNLVEQKETYYYQVQQGEDYPYVIKRVVEAFDGRAIKIWRCECKYYIKVGIPCWHELKVCLIEKADMSPQINPFWMKTSLVPVHQRVRNQHDVKHWGENQQNPTIELQQKISEREIAKLDEVVRNIKPYDFTSNNPVEEEYNHWNDDVRQSDKSSETNLKQKAEPPVFDVDNEDCVILDKDQAQEESMLKEEDILDLEILQAQGQISQDNENKQNTKLNEAEQREEKIGDDQMERLIQGLENMSSQEESEQEHWSKVEDQIKNENQSREMQNQS